MKKLTIGATSFIAGALLMTGISGYAAPALEKVSAYINNTVTLKLNGEKVETSQPILTYNDRTYVYLKDVGELVGAEVSWNNAERSVEIVNNPAVDGDEATTIQEGTDTDNEKGENTSFSFTVRSDFGFELVYTYKGIDYVGLREVMSKPTNGTYFTLDIPSEKYSLLNSDGKILVEKIPFEKIDGQWAIKYDYYLELLLPLIS
ncbi:stalk domain-containing protein [Paenibacillus sp. HB172176]|uniref:stalk domain-containing protein n=1 Tax=Paenibacillus sp. HB172176 TaxID=2493690 RepID=UPI001439678D|nr:stalk domain-containing protein [Paenibacillus sp. HB172176]